MDKTTILKAFNNQFEEFLEDVEVLFPDNTDIKTSKTGLLMLRKANPTRPSGTMRKHWQSSWRLSATSIPRSQEATTILAHSTSKGSTRPRRWRTS